MTKRILLQIQKYKQKAVPSQSGRETVVKSELWVQGFKAVHQVSALYLCEPNHVHFISYNQCFSQTDSVVWIINVNCALF